MRASVVQGWAGSGRRGLESRQYAVLRRDVHAAQATVEAQAGAPGLFQLCIFRLGFLQHGNIRGGVFFRA